ncbi:MAG: sterol desaturase family protein [Phycisphaerales bacterium]|nr:sterol desaturase family protein [Phycisphaerales bacterium]
MFFLHDFYFYWMHRVIHHRRLYKLFHMEHHKSHKPTPWTAYSFSPLEAILEIAIIPIFAFLIPIQVWAIFIFFTFQIIYNVYIHLGYELFPKTVNNHWIRKWFNTATAHDFHHHYNKKNYGLYTTIWDRLFNTYYNVNTNIAKEKSKA